MQPLLRKERKALNLDPNNDEAHCNIGWIFYLRSVSEQLSKKRNWRLRPIRQIFLAYSMNLSLASLEDYDLAISAFNAGHFCIDPFEDFNTYMNLGAALGRKKDYPQAVSDVQAGN
ncbi:MAG: hypothetical protein U0103_11615 [Candidatus Obscuribacterales bacterium]